MKKMSRNIGLSFFAIVLLKSLFFLTHHIQEDAYITWRVAQNLLDYGVIGFNGNTPISASTTHLYTFISFLFNAIFGKENFIYPLLVFNSILFSLGTWQLLRIFISKETPLILGLFVLNFIPPSIKISILGMEFGLVFFLYTTFLNLGMIQRKKWAYIVFPFLLLWTRLDTAIFLGIFFVFDGLKHRRWNFAMMWAGLFALISVLWFNYSYFGDWLNNTIIAKSIAYPYTFRWQMILGYIPNYWGIVKVPDSILSFNFFTFIVLLIELAAYISLLFTFEFPHKKTLSMLFVFAWVKQIIFIARLSLFDWYYWTPQIFLFSCILLFMLYKISYRKWIYNFSLFLLLPMLLYQVAHSMATGNGEWNYRKEIGNYLSIYEEDKNETIFLEPAGYIPFYSGLKTIDFVGLVDKEIQAELRKDNKYFIQPTLQKRQPKYYLSLTEKEVFRSARDSLYFQKNYMLIKHFEINSVLHPDNELLRSIYNLKPSGRDYWLYRRYDSF